MTIPQNNQTHAALYSGSGAYNGLGGDTDIPVV